MPRENAFADIGGKRIECIKGREIRFSYWKDKDGKFQAPLELNEDELLILFGEAAIGKGVFTNDFLRDLQGMLNGHLGDEKP